jgi:lipopolysaccharide/colanic/teichoic acid biosynthesis glycosyltransferase
MKQLRESVRRLKRGRKEDIVLVRRWFPQFCFHNMRCVRKLAAYASDAKADVIRYSPVKYNNEIIFPDKVQINLDYYYTHTFRGDLKLIFQTIFHTYPTPEIQK